MISRILPFIEWFKGYSLSDLRTDVLAGVTVALVLIPQSMAYAQLAGLPAYYGLYASFLPPLVAALFGSSRQLATGPVAVVSLMTAASLEPLATAGSEGFIAYAVMLAFLVGLFQFLLGVLRLGLVVNFLSHPVVNGFTNAAAIIIASSQLSKLFGVYVDKAPHHYETIIRVVENAFHYTHWPTLGMGALAITTMVGLKKINPRIPNVLVAVVITTLLSWAIGFNHDARVDISTIKYPEFQEKLVQFNSTVQSINTLGEQRAEIGKVIENANEQGDAIGAIDAQHDYNVVDTNIARQKQVQHELRTWMRDQLFTGVKTGSGLAFYPQGQLPAGAESDGRTWRLKLGNTKLDTSSLKMMGGGAVVGTIPSGLPKISAPSFDFKVMLRLLPFAAIISLLGFMEAISIAKAMAAKTGQRLDPNQELIGQGLATCSAPAAEATPRPVRSPDPQSTCRRVPYRACRAS